MEILTQKFYTRTEADAITAAALLRKSGGIIRVVVPTSRWFRRRNPGKNFVIKANRVPVEAMRAFLQGDHRNQ